MRCSIAYLRSRAKRDRKKIDLEQTSARLRWAQVWRYWKQFLCWKLGLMQSRLKRKLLVMFWGPTLIELKETTNHKFVASGVEEPSNPVRMHRAPLPQAGDALVFECCLNSRRMYGTSYTYLSLDPCRKAWCWDRQPTNRLPCAAQRQLYFPSDLVWGKMRPWFPMGGRCFAFYKKKLEDVIVRSKRGVRN